MQRVTTFSTTAETETRIAEERKRLEQLLPDTKITRSSTIRVLIARGSGVVAELIAKAEHAAKAELIAKAEHAAKAKQTAKAEHAEQAALT